MSYEEPRKTITLSAEHLCLKGGFCDGDLLSSRQVLIAAVCKYLVPLLDPGVELYEIENAHNPIRATDETIHLVDTSISVDVPLSELVVLGHGPEYVS